MILEEHPWKKVSVHCLLPVPLSIKREENCSAKKFNTSA